MEEKNKNYISGKDIKSAKELFKDIVRRNDFQHIISKSNRMKKLEEMSDEKMWLAPWMSRTEEFWVILTGDRLWNTIYKQDKNSASNMIVVDINNEEIKIDGVDDIEELLMDDDEYSESIPISLKYLIGELAFSSCIEIENGMAVLKQSNIQLNEIAENIYIPLEYEEMVAVGFKKYLTRSQESILKLAKKKVAEEDYEFKKEKTIQKGLDHTP